MAGEYPGSMIAEVTRQSIRQLFEAGVTVFVDLTEEAELGPYEALALQEAAATGRAIEYWRVAVRDRGIPSVEKMQHILDTIDRAIEAEQTVYVHCLAGLGRTGTVVGCYLVRHGMSGEVALKEIARLRKGIPMSFLNSPETVAQREMVLNWPIEK